MLQREYPPCNSNSKTTLKNIPSFAWEYNPFLLFKISRPTKHKTPHKFATLLNKTPKTKSLLPTQKTHFTKTNIRRGGATCNRRRLSTFPYPNQPDSPRSASCHHHAKQPFAQNHKYGVVHQPVPSIQIHISHRQGQNFKKTAASSSPTNCSINFPTQNFEMSISLIPIGCSWCEQRHSSDDDGYHYPPPVSAEGGGDDDDVDYDYAPAA